MCQFDVLLCCMMCCYVGVRGGREEQNFLNYENQQNKIMSSLHAETETNFLEWIYNF